MNITQEPTKDVPLTFNDINYHEDVYCEHCGLEAVLTKKDLKYNLDDGVKFPECPRCGYPLANMRGSTKPTLTRTETNLIARHKLRKGCSIMISIPIFLVILFIIILIVVL